MNIDSSTSDESSDDEPTRVTSACAMPAPRPLPLPQRPQVGMKTPKSSFPPKRCINAICKEEKQALKEEIALLKAEIDDLKSSSKAAPRGDVLTPSGRMDAAEASRRGVRAFTIINYCLVIILY